MDKRTKEKILYIFLIVAIMVLPNIFLYSKMIKNQDRFFESLGERYETCLKKAKEDSVDARYCREISIASENTFLAADNSIEISYIMFFIEMLFFSLIIGVRKLRARIEELEKKLDV
ncbi:MAG: hypothetical protein M3T96_03445 [Acidobacteriota bacterium]|nr:hypothetical protein [Acidobacteriota bacterium]